MPESLGNCPSMTTTSGCFSSATSTASRPSTAVATTWISNSLSRIRLMTLSHETLSVDYHDFRVHESSPMKFLLDQKHPLVIGFRAGTGYPKSLTLHKFHLQTDRALNRTPGRGQKTSWPHPSGGERAPKTSRGRIHRGTRRYESRVTSPSTRCNCPTITTWDNQCASRGWAIRR